MNNILGVMPQIETLRLNIGTNFSPEVRHVVAHFDIRYLLNRYIICLHSTLRTLSPSREPT